MSAYTAVKLTYRKKVAELTLNRPDKANALNETMWYEIEAAIRSLDTNPEVRAIVLRAEGSRFCAGIDFEFISNIMQKISHQSDGHKQEKMLRIIRTLQHSFTALENCRKPIIAAIHGQCLGGGIDLITACDIRHASTDATFSVKEVDLGIVADVGTLQRLPRIVGEGVAREWCLTACTIQAEEAQRRGLVNQLASDQQSLWQLAHEQAALLAEKSPLAIRGTKHILNYSRDHSVQQGLDYVAAWNAGMLLSSDLKIALEAITQQRKPEFPD
jgi:enoyl-CoA hydratase